MYLALAGIFLTGLLSASRTRLVLGATLVLAALVLLTGLAGIVRNEFQPVSIALGVLVCGLSTVLLTRDLVTRDEAVTAETLWRAVNIYVLAGLFFAFVYSSIAFFQPDAFVGKFMDEPLRTQVYGFVYFSFVTLTTLGYGDLAPNNPTVGALAYMQALFGQLYIAIMVARLVSLYVTDKGKSDE
jgi:hypothetical protein